MDCKLHNSNDVGVYIYNGGMGHFKRCEVTENNLGGVQVQDSSDPIFEDCLIHNGKGVGLFVLKESHGTFIRCNISNFAVSNFSVAHGGVPTMVECEIVETDDKSDDSCDSYAAWRKTLFVTKKDDTVFETIIFQEKKAVTEKAIALQDPSYAIAERNLRAKARLAGVYR